MAKLTKIINGRYVGPDKYKITDTSDGKKQIVFSPDSVLEEGTPIGAEILNEIQNNGLYYLIGTHRVSGQESIYDCTLEGIDSFEFTQLCVLFKPNTTPTQSTIKLNISGQVYTLANTKILNSNQLGLLLIKSESKAYGWSNYVQVVNDLTTGGADKAGSAEMVKKLGEDKQDKTDSELETNSKKIVGAINESLWSILPKEIGSTSVKDDLNNYRAPGFYSSGDGSLWDNLPKELQDKAGIGFHLRVFSYANKISYSEQILFCPQTRKTYRRDVGDKNSWSEWVEILNDGNKLFLNALGTGSKQFIQDNIPKVKDSLYIDKDTMKLYRAKVANNDITVTNNFALESINENNKQISNINSAYYFYSGGITPSEGYGGVTRLTTNKIQITSQGLYEITATGTDQSGSIVWDIRINGSVIYSPSYATENRLATGNCHIIKSLNAGDTVELYDGGDARRWTGFKIVKLRG